VDYFKGNNKEIEGHIIGLTYQEVKKYLKGAKESGVKPKYVRE